MVRDPYVGKLLKFRVLDGFPDASVPPTLMHVKQLYQRGLR